jgi:hypothetical protein
MRILSLAKFLGNACRKWSRSLCRYHWASRHYSLYSFLCRLACRILHMVEGGICSSQLALWIDTWGLYMKEPSCVPHSCYYLLAYPACLSWTSNRPWIVFGYYLLMEFLGGESFPDFIWYCLYMVAKYVVLHHKEHSHSVELIIPPPQVSCQRTKCSFIWKLGICSCHMEFGWLCLIN